MSMPSGVTIGTAVETGSALVAAVAVPVNRVAPITAAADATAMTVRRRERRGDMGGGTP